MRHALSTDPSTGARLAVEVGDQEQPAWGREVRGGVSRGVGEAVAGQLVQVQRGREVTDIRVIVRAWLDEVPVTLTGGGRAAVIPPWSRSAEGGIQLG
jgi:hypothetical protein